MGSIVYMCVQWKGRVGDEGGANSLKNMYGYVYACVSLYVSSFTSIIVMGTGST